LVIVGQQPPNDPSIVDAEVLLRRLLSDWIVPGEEGRMRIASAAFKHYELSIQFKSLLIRQGRGVEDALRGYPNNSLCSITAGLARELDQGVVYDPEPPHDPAHGLVVGKKTQRIANRFAREASWVIPSEAPTVLGQG
jgi:hypothetical protein